MKRKILLSLGILFCMNGFAQNVKIVEPKIEESDDKVFVTFTAVADKIKSNERLTLTPVLYSGDKSKSLESITITGRNRAISDKRQLASAGIRTEKNQHISYNVTVPYESWMGDVSLRIERKIESCCTEQSLAFLDVAREKTIRYDVVIEPIKPIAPRLTPIEKFDLEAPFLYPISEYKAVKEDFDALRAEGALIIHFKLGSNSIDPDYRENAQSLKQINTILSLIENDPRASLGKILLAGGASPEGSVQRNQDLSQQRVNVLKEYLGSKYTSRNDLFDVITIGEDWVGLRKMVEASDMQYKQEVLNIINTVAVEKGREKQLMDLKWGRPYNYMREHFFPQLRSAGYIRVFYESKPEPDLIATNQAIKEFNMQKYKDVLIRLEGLKSTITTENMRGVCYMMLGEYDKAQAALHKSIELGGTQAAQHIKQLEKLKKIER